MVLVYAIRLGFALMFVLTALTIMAYPLNWLFGGRGRDWDDMLRNRPMAGTWWIMERYRPQILKVAAVFLVLAVLTLPFGD